MHFGLRDGEFHDGSVAGTIGEKTDARNDGFA